MTTIATITIPALTNLAAQTGPNVDASLFDNNWAGTRSALSGVVASATDIAAAIDAAFAAVLFPRSYLSGYGTANNASDATNDIDIAVGSAIDSTNAKNIVLTGALTKRTDAAWAVGTNQGGLDIGTVGNRTYHIYSILRSDTGVVDALFSCNPGRAATVTMTIASPCVVTMTNHGLQAGSSVVFTTTGALPTGLTAGTRYYVISAGLTADAFEVSATDGGAAINTSGSQSGVHTATSNPVMPTSYDYFRRIWSIVRSGGAILAYIQTGDYGELSAPVQDVAATNPGTSAVTRTLTLPVGHILRAIFNIGLEAATSGAGTRWYISNLATPDVVPADTAAPGSGITADSTGTRNYFGPFECFTNKVAQVRSRAPVSGAADVFRLSTLGWIDRRGRDD